MRYCTLPTANETFLAQGAVVGIPNVVKRMRARAKRSSLLHSTFPLRPRVILGHTPTFWALLDRPEFVHENPPSTIYTTVKPPFFNRNLSFPEKNLPSQEPQNHVKMTRRPKQSSKPPPPARHPNTSASPRPAGKTRQSYAQSAENHGVVPSAPSSGQIAPPAPYGASHSRARTAKPARLDTPVRARRGRGTPRAVLVCWKIQVKGVVVTSYARRGTRPPAMHLKRRRTARETLPLPPRPRPSGQQHGPSSGHGPDPPRQRGAHDPDGVKRPLDGRMCRQGLALHAGRGQPRSGTACGAGRGREGGSDPCGKHAPTRAGPAWAKPRPSWLVGHGSC